MIQNTTDYMCLMNHNGEFIKLFEERVADYTGAKYAVAVDSGTNAIFLCIKYLNYTGDIVIPKRTYMSVPMSIINAGARPVFKDISWRGQYRFEPVNIIDACNEFYPGMYRDDSCFYILSFQEKKRLPIGKGGMILTNDGNAAKVLRRMAFDGRDYMLGANEDKDITLGYHMNFTPRQAAEGLLRLNQMDINQISPSIGDEIYRDLSKMECFSEYM